MEFHFDEELSKLDWVGGAVPVGPVNLEECLDEAERRLRVHRPVQVIPANNLQMARVHIYKELSFSR